MVYRCDCRFLLYSLHFSEFMLIFFTRKRTKHENTRSPPFLYDTKMAAAVNGLASRRKPTQVSYLRSTCVSFRHPLTWTLVELQVGASPCKPTQAHASPRKPTQAHASHLIYSLQDSWSGMNYIAVIGTLILVAFFQLGPGEKQGAIR